MQYVGGSGEMRYIHSFTLTVYLMMWAERTHSLILYCNCVYYLYCNCCDFIMWNYMRKWININMVCSFGHKMNWWAATMKQAFTKLNDNMASSITIYAIWIYMIDASYIPHHFCHTMVRHGTLALECHCASIICDGHQCASFLGFIVFFYFWTGWAL